MKIVIPMAGEGSRFASVGYDKPKPLIDVNGKPMIGVVTENLKFDAEYIFLVRKKHLEAFDLEKIISSLVCKYKIVNVDSLTEGAACTVLLAKEYINTDESLLIVNSDQFVEYSSENFKLLMDFSVVDGIILTFVDNDKKWSFVRQDDTGKIVEVAEKKPISNIATAGAYYFRKGRDFVKYAEQMINQNDRVNSEFYVAPVYNYLIKDNKIIIPFFVTKMWGLGTPEDLDYYLQFKK